MDFTHPERLWLLGLVPVLALWVVRHRGLRAHDWHELGRSGAPRGDRAWRWVWASLLLIVALAGPRWGRLPWAELPPGHDVVLVVDGSRSMAVEDAVPSRLGVAVECADGLIRALGREPGSRIAVVAFAGRGVVRCPLTENLGAGRDTLRSLRAGEVRPGGTNLGSALETALETFDEQEPAEGRTIVLFTDGEDHAGSWERVLASLRTARVIVHAVAIGDAERGHPVPRAEGRSEPLRYHGETVLSQRQDSALEALTNATGGALLQVGLASADLGTLYESRIAPIAARQRAASRVPERVERYSFFVFGALVLGLSGSWPGLRRIPTLTLFLMVIMAGAGPAHEDRNEAGPAGNAAYATGDYQRALDAFERASAASPRSAIARYNMAASLFQLGRYAEAEARYREARDFASPTLRLKIDYALGNVALMQGRFAEAVQLYDECLQSETPGDQAASVQRDAAINREYAVRRRPPPNDDTTDGGPNPAPRPSETPGGENGSDEDPGRSDNDPSRSDSPEGTQNTAGVARPPGEPQGNREEGPGAAPGQSPEAELDKALRNAHEARRRRLTDEVSSIPDEEQKDW